MADETIILDFKIEQGDALTELERTKKSILQLKDEQKELNDEYKRGTKNLDDYTKETVQLEAALKKQSAQYGEIQKKVTGIKSPFDKLNESIKDQAKSVTVAGVSLQSFLNPATAAVAAVGALTAVYAASSKGAKDLEFAQSELSATTKILADDFVDLFGASSQDGKGFFSTQLTGMLKNMSTFSKEMFGTSGTLGRDVERQALIQQKMQDLQRKETEVLANNARRRAENSDLQTQILDSHTKYNAKLKLSDQILANTKQNQVDLLKVKQQELSGAQFLLSLHKDDEVLQGKVGDAQRALEDARKQTARDIKAAEVSKSNIIDANEKIVAQEKQINSELEQQANLAKLNRKLAGDPEKDVFDKEDLLKVKLINNANDVFAVTQKIFQKRMDNNAKENKEEANKTKIAKLEASNRLATISSYLGQAQSLFAEDSAAYKIMGVGRATVDTYRAADLALATYPPPFGEIAAGVAIATGLANVAKILDVGFSGGGYTGSGSKHEIAGTVHKGEVVWSQADVALAGGASRVNSMRPTYSDGGITADYMSRQSSAQGMQNQAVQVTLVYEEFKRFTQGINFKEQATSR